MPLSEYDLEPLNNNPIQEAAAKYLDEFNDVIPITRGETFKILFEAFIAGAKWQSETNKA